MHAITTTHKNKTGEQMKGREYGEENASIFCAWRTILYILWNTRT